MINDDALNVPYPDFEYDMVFTSPPYSYKEKYLHMPVYFDFLKDFLIPMVKKTYANLKSKGNYCLNIPQKHYIELIKVLGHADNIFDIKKNHRPAKHGGVTKYQEHIYHWVKP